MKTLLPLSLSLALIFQLEANSQNLVPNPSFEDFTDCPNTLGRINQATGWNSAEMTSCDYYHECYDNPYSPGMDVPAHGMNGYQEARTGGAYAGIIIVGSQEKILAKLISPLQKDVTYRVEFYVNVHNDVPLGCDGIGMFISENEITSNAILNQSSPQIHNPLGEVLTDTLNWTLVSGQYTAKGGEQFIAIGNFLDPADAKTEVINTSVISPTPMSSYFYIDDVSISVDPLASINELSGADLISIFPNPATDRLTIANKGNTIDEVRIVDVTGKLQASLSGSTKNVDVSYLSEGIYFIQLLTGEGVVTKKFVKE